MASVRHLKISDEEYLQLEDDAEFKHELICGEIVAMSGGQFEHILIAANLLTALKNELDGKGCIVLGSDLRVKAGTAHNYFYPDLTICCEPPKLLNNTKSATLVNPTAIFEILSASTEARDRGLKMQAYFQIESLKTYVLVSTTAHRIELYERTSSGWVSRLIDGPDALLEMTAPAVNIPFNQIYGSK